MKISARDYFPVRTVISPVSAAAASTTTSTYVLVNDCYRVMGVFNLGALTGGTVTCSFMQATSAAGAGAKALSAGNFAAVANAVDNTQTIIEGETDLLDDEAGFIYVAVRCVVASGSGSLISASLHAVDPDFKS